MGLTRKRQTSLDCMRDSRDSRDSRREAKARKDKYDPSEILLEVIDFFRVLSGRVKTLIIPTDKLLFKTETLAQILFR